MLAALSVSGMLLILSIQTQPKAMELEEHLSWVRCFQILDYKDCFDMGACDTVVSDSSHSRNLDNFDDQGDGRVGLGLLRPLRGDLRADYRL